MLPKNAEIVRFCNWWMGIGLTPKWRDKKQEFLELCVDMNHDKPKNRPYQVVLVGPEIIMPTKGKEILYGDTGTAYIRFLPAVAKFDRRYTCVAVFKY